MNSEKTELEAEKLLDNMDLTLDEDETENQSSNDLTLTPPEHDVFEDASLYDARITEEAFYASRSYAIHPNGFFKRIYPKDGQPYWKKIHNFFAIPYLKLSTAKQSSGVKTAETNTGYTGVRFLNNDLEINEIALSSSERAEFTSSKSRLTANDWTPPAGSDRSDVYKAFMEAAQAGYEPHVRPNGKIYPAFIKRMTGYTQRGWVTPELHIRSKHDLYVGKVATQSEKMGDPEIQKQVLREIIKQSPAVRIFLAGTFAAYTKGRICISDEFCPIVNYVGEGEKGKSTTLRICASIEGSPSKGKMVIEGVSTEAGVENFATAYNHGPVFLDEIDELLRMNELSKRIMRLTNGGGRVIYDTEKTFKQPNVWNGMFFTTSNTPLKDGVRGDGKETAILTRLIEININDPDLHIFYPDKNDGGKVNEWMSKLAVNYGNIYDEIIQYIINNADELEEKLEDFESQLLTTEELRYFKKYRRSAHTLALVMLGAEMMEPILGKESSMLTHDAITIYKNKYAQDVNDEIDYADYKYISHLETLYEWINANKGMICWSKFAYAEQSEDQYETLDRTQKKMAQALTNNATHRGSVLAEVKVNRIMDNPDDFEGTIVLNAMGIKHLKQHAQLDFHELCQSLEKLGMVEHDAKFTGKKKEELGLSTTRNVRLTLKPIDELRSDMINSKNSRIIASGEKTEGQTEILNQNNADNEFNINKILEASSQLEEDYSAYFDRA
ncbi:TPA_asm: DUF927 domain-containing protein [Salmonella enterica subsp. enterica serovar Infantis]|uniref:DUF927 domain-containing protein n=1 Tax=Salmonella infantis TaxID=595 RepID=A0A6X7X4W4_SALIN|nr:DUF927 domain-containing protein [Salmonella enterica subsp. enterica serovar Infantis]